MQRIERRDQDRIAGYVHRHSGYGGYHRSVVGRRDGARILRDQARRRRLRWANVLGQAGGILVLGALVKHLQR